MGNIEKGQIVNFDMRKQFKFIDNLGKGGTGRALLFKDETTDMLFAIKKYETEDQEHKEEFYDRFVDEIKILFKLTHPNIVRVYNYYLYPQEKVGYLQMEYVKGVSLNNYFPSIFDTNWREVEDIFKETIFAFEYLEKNHILHRDIRPQNILIDDEGNVKIIDFGFGKMLQSDISENDDNSVILNWPVTQLPEDITLYGKYNHTTEIYFLGKLFEHFIKEREIKESFKYTHIIEKMIQVERDKRYQSFTEIVSAISELILRDDYFNDEERSIYLNFASALNDHIAKLSSQIKRKPIKEIIENLQKVLKNNMLDEFIQSNSELIHCFTDEFSSYYTKINIEYKTVESFYKLLIALPEDKQQIVLDNIYTKLSNIKIETQFDDLPF